MGVDKFKPYTFGSEKVNAQVSLNGQLFPAITESGTLTVIINSGDLQRALGDDYDLGVATSGNQEGIPFDIYTWSISITGFVDGYPRDDADFSFGVTGKQSSVLGDVNEINTQYSGQWEPIVQETMDSLAYDVQSGNLKEYKYDTSSFDFLFVTGTYQSGVGPTAPPTEYPFTGYDVPTFDFEFVTGTYQGQ